MTKKRFWCLDEYKGETSPIVDGEFAPTNEWLCNKLNELYKENEQLKFKKDRYKTLSEIRQESINNRILTIKEFIDNCSDKKVKKTLGQLFHSEVNEYDLSKKIRKLEKENKQLKLQMLNIEEDRDYFKSKASSLEEGYIKLQDQEIRLKKENGQLKAQLKDCEKRVTDKEVEWLRNNTVCEQMPSNKRTYTTTNAKEDYK